MQANATTAGQPLLPAADTHDYGTSPVASFADLVARICERGGASFACVQLGLDSGTFETAPGRVREAAARYFERALEHLASTEAAEAIDLVRGDVDPDDPRELAQRAIRYLTDCLSLDRLWSPDPLDAIEATFHLLEALELFLARDALDRIRAFVWLDRYYERRPSSRQRVPSRADEQAISTGAAAERLATVEGV